MEVTVAVAAQVAAAPLVARPRRALRVQILRAATVVKVAWLVTAE